MTKEEIQKNSEHWYNKYKDAEKRIAELEKEKQGLKDYCDRYTKTILSLRQNVEELENKIADIKANCDLAIEGRDVKIKELTDRLEDLQEQNSEMFNTIALQEQQIEKLIDFVLSKTECCDVCPITDTCVNSEGTCPYVGILAKGEEEVTREWLMQFISRR